MNRLAKRVHELMGVHMPPSEKNFSLMKNRTAKILRSHKWTSFEELADKMDRPSPELLEAFISALTTNKTHFFREEAHFEFLKKQLKDHFQRHSDLRIWCAAASTGQEPYTLAILLAETVSAENLKKSRILATDIDLEVLKKGVNGVYTEPEMEGCPSHLRKKIF